MPSPRAAIVGYGTYVPRGRLSRSDVAAVLGSGTLKGSRSVASYDEDTTTMGVEAARRALAGTTPEPNLYFATTAPAYTDKTNASAIHAALNLPHEAFAVDLAGSVRGTVGALRAGSASGGLVVLADMRTGLPGSGDERDGGDGAAAFVFGEPSAAVAEIIGEASATSEFLDRWRAPGTSTSALWEERFGAEIYGPMVKDVAARCLVAAGVEQADHVVVSSPHLRTARSAARRLGGTTSVERHPGVGYTGAADPGLLLAAALDEAEPGQTILLVVAADGCDAILLRCTDRAAAARAEEPALRDIPYGTYLTWRGMLEREPPRRPEPDRPAGPPSARSQEWKFGLVGSRCTACSHVHMPAQRVCSNCRTVDEMEPVRLAEQLGTVATFTVDRLAFSLSPPVINIVLDLDGGGRLICQATDADPADVAIGTRMEMTFRRLYTAHGVHNYFWKARVAHSGTEPKDEV